MYCFIVSVVIYVLVILVIKYSFSITFSAIKIISSFQTTFECLWNVAWKQEIID